MVKAGLPTHLALAAICFAAVFNGVPRAVAGDTIVLPDRPLERRGLLAGTYRLAQPRSGTGILTIEWTDALGRLVEHSVSGFKLHATRDVPFRLDLGRAAARLNHLHLRVVLNGDAAGQSDADTEFITVPAENAWREYQIIEWQPRPAKQYAGLKRIGVTAGTVIAADRERPDDGLSPRLAPLLDVDLGWYVENIATDFYAAYHRWYPDRPVNWRFAELQQRYQRDPDDAAALMREPSLSDPQWLARIRNRLTRAVRAHRVYRPLYYSLGDETGIADLSAYWDFDWSPASLDGFRTWLRHQYGSLDALNREWETRFTRWDAVLPDTTAAALQRRDGNYAAWSDFKAWMDEAFARALRAGTAAVHAADPGARAAIEGAQIPGWGGYDYTRLATAVDVIELYDAGDNMEIIRSLAPASTMLTTSSLAGPEQRYDVWRALLRGSRGLILWDDKSALVGDDGSLRPRAIAAAPLFAELRDGLGALLMNSERHTDPIAMLYSPASMRLAWLLDQQGKGDSWSRLTADDAYPGGAILASMQRFARALEHMGLQHRIVSPEQIAHDALLRHGYRVLILPRSIALAQSEADAIHRFVAAGGTVIIDGEAGTYDEHGRRRTRPLLNDLPRASLPKSAGGSIAMTTGSVTANAGAPTLPTQLHAELAAHRVVPLFVLTRADGARVGDVELYRFKFGDATILALLRDRTDALGGDADETVTVELSEPAYVYDLRRHLALGRQRTITVQLTDDGPTVLAVVTQVPAPPLLSAPPLHRGERGQVAIAPSGKHTPSLLHITVKNPSGASVSAYSGTLLVTRPTVWPLPLALSDPIGTWHVQAEDLISGTVTSLTVQVAAP